MIGVLTQTCLMLQGGCGGTQSALDPAGPGAARIGDIWWLMLLVCTAVLVAVIVTLLWAIARRRRPPPDALSGALRVDPQRERRMAQVVGGAIAATVGIVLLFVIASFWIGRELVAEPTGPTLSIDVTGQRWWWDLRYNNPVPSKGFSTANEIHIPVGRPVRLTLRSIDVIHSFWVPNLQGKKDLIPGQVNTLYIQADRPGVFRGQCAEFCGFQHAHMALYVVASRKTSSRAGRSSSDGPLRRRRPSSRGRAATCSCPPPASSATRSTAPAQAASRVRT